MPKIIGGICDGSSMEEGKKYRPYLVIVTKWSNTFYIYHLDTKTGDYLFEEWIERAAWGKAQKKRYRTACVIMVDYGEEETTSGKIPTLVVVDQGVIN